MAARRMSKLVIIMVALLSAFARVLTAAKMHVVGDTLGWTIPPNGSTTYANWAESHTFVLGDTLVFEFMNGVHDVTLVTKTDYKTCNADKPISRITESPARITLNTTTGECYYICGFPGHCNAGQKLAIKVVTKPASTTPLAPPPSFPPHPHPSRSPSPAPTLAPTPGPRSPRPIGRRQRHGGARSPARSPMVFTVGDEMAWTIPHNATAYQEWANGKNFMVGDILVFNYRSRSHDVAEVTHHSFDSCTTATDAPPLSHSAEPPTNITLMSPGSHFFLCTVSGHCSLGQRLAINVANPSGALPPSSALPPMAYDRDAAVATAPPPGSYAVKPREATAWSLVAYLIFFISSCM